MTNKYKENNKIIIKSIIHEAWTNVKGFKPTFWGAYFLLILIIFAVILADISLHFLGHWVGIPHASIYIVTIFILLSQLFLLPLQVGLFMLSLKRIQQMPIKATMIFDYYRWSLMWRFFVISILSYIIIHFLTSISLLSLPLLIIPVFIVVSIITPIWYFSLMLITDKQLSAWAALKAASQAVWHHFFKIIGLTLISIVFFILSVVTLFIGAIWLWPFANNLYATLYHKIFSNTYLN